jgi:hypothetical protein
MTNNNPRPPRISPDAYRAQVAIAHATHTLIPNRPTKKD